MSDEPHSPTPPADADAPDARPRRAHFIRDIVEADLAAGKYGGRVITRFPPEPNGYLHIGHAKAICLSFGIAEDYGGTYNLRFDDTNPITEEAHFVEAIEEDIRWLGYDWGETKFASDYFEQMYLYAEMLVEKGVAYVDSLTPEQIREYRGTVTEPGRESPYRDRPVEESLDLFRRMRAGEFPDGTHVLRARIDMAASNMLMRDPLLYRIRHATHHRTGDDWCIYPMYDFAHCLEDAFEGVSHSFCTLEFEINREIYDWLLDQSEWERRPRQYEFARLNLSYTKLSKRYFLRLVGEGHVSGWDDPRMMSLRGLRRRGVTPEAIRALCDMVGVAKANSTVDLGKLEYCLREDLNHRSPRVLCVLRPLRLVITNYPEDRVETLDAPYWPHDVPKEGSRPLPFARELLVERDDFQEDPPRKWHRLAPGREVRLRHAYVVKCEEVVEDPDTGEVVELRCTYDPETLDRAPEGRKVRGTIHWVSAAHALPCEVRLYDRMFVVEKPGSDPDREFTEELNPESLVRLTDARIEPSVAGDGPGARYQFERQGYFCPDSVDSRPGALVFNRTVTLRDSWAKIARKAVVPERAAAPKPKPKSAARPQAPPARPIGPVITGRIERFTTELGLDADDADRLARDKAVAAFFEEAVAAHDDAPSVARWTVNELLREIKDTPVSALPFSGGQFGALVALVDGGTISHAAGKDVFAVMMKSGGDPAAIVDEKGLRGLSGADELAVVVDGVIGAHPDEAARYRGGRTGLLGFFTGQVMKAARGRADAREVRRLLEERLA
jgi:glutaminyl-tRNA synthetase